LPTIDFSGIYLLFYPGKGIPIPGISGMKSSAAGQSVSK
jgi:hypothetical protein